jgi:hypothetical protein
MAFEIDNSDEVIEVHNDAGQGSAKRLTSAELNAIRDAAHKLRAEAVSVRSQIATLQGADAALDGRLDTLEAATTNAAFFVDSVSGSDANSGLAHTAPLQTIAALLGKTIPTGSTIYLARGSHWRERLAGLASGVSVVASGSGPRPLLDCSDVAAPESFVKTGGRTNVYEIAWSHSITGASRHNLWEDGARLTRVADVATCDATPGSFYAPAPTAGPDTIYVHPTGSGNLTTNGKVYELSRRNTALEGAHEGSIISIHTRRNGANDGSLISHHYAKDCLAEDGTVHNFWVEGVAEDCVAWKNDYAALVGSATLFVTFPGTGVLRGATYRRCKAIGSVNGGGSLGYYFHTAGGGQRYGRVVFEECEASDVSAGFGGADVDIALLYKCRTRRVGEGVTINATVAVYVLGGTFDGAEGTPALERALHPEGTGKLVVRGTRFIARGNSNLGLIIGAGEFDIQRCTFASPQPDGYFRRPVWMTTGGAQKLTFQNNIVSGATHLLEIPAGVTLDSDENVLHGAMEVTIGATTHANIAAYQSATGQDAASVTTDPLLLAARSGDTRLADASPAWAIQAGADYEGDGDRTLAELFLTYSSGP